MKRSSAISSFISEAHLANLGLGSTWGNTSPPPSPRRPRSLIQLNTLNSPSYALRLIYSRIVTLMPFTVFQFHMLWSRTRKLPRTPRPLRRDTRPCDGFRRPSSLPYHSRRRCVPDVFHVLAPISTVLPNDVLCILEQLPGHVVVNTIRPLKLPTTYSTREHERSPLVPSASLWPAHARANRPAAPSSRRLRAQPAALHSSSSTLSLNRGSGHDPTPTTHRKPAAQRGERVELARGLERRVRRCGVSPARTALAPARGARAGAHHSDSARRAGAPGGRPHESPVACVAHYVRNLNGIATERRCGAEPSWSAVAERAGHAHQGGADTRGEAARAWRAQGAREGLLVSRECAWLLSESKEERADHAGDVEGRVYEAVSQPRRIEVSSREGDMCVCGSACACPCAHGDGGSIDVWL